MDCEPCHGGGRLFSGENYASGNFEDSVSECLRCVGSGRVSNGYRERAEFIRVQVELASRDWLVDFNEGHTCALDPCPLCNDVADWRRLRKVERHWIETNRKALQAAWRPLTIGLLRQGVPDDFHSEGFALFARGFVREVRGPLAAMRRHLPAVCREHPVETVTPTDKRPHEVFWGDGTAWEWGYTENWDRAGVTSALPQAVYERLADPPYATSQKGQYDSVAEGFSYLSAALIAEARETTQRRDERNAGFERINGLLRQIQATATSPQDRRR